MTRNRLAFFTLFLVSGCNHTFIALEEDDAGSRSDGGAELDAGRPEDGGLDAGACEDVCAEGETACRGASVVTCSASREGCLEWGPEEACASPPPAECTEGAILRTYAATGACADGSCAYAASEMPCMFGCAEGRCIASELALDTYIKASNTDVRDVFGHSVSLSADGSVLAVGAHEEDSATTEINGDQHDNSASNGGAVYVFRRNAAGIWAQEAYIKASNTNANDWFGHSVSLSADGSVLAVGAILEASAATGINGDQHDNSALNSGAVYLFRRSAGTWAQEAYIKASNSNANDLFGASVSLSADGSVLAVGASQEASGATGINGDQRDNSAERSGVVYLFRRSAAGTWAQEAYIKASNSNANDLFGVSVSLSADGSVLAVGAYFEASAAASINGDQHDNSASSSGAVYLFRRSAAGSWTQESYIKASNADEFDGFGTRVSLSADGSVLAVGAAYEDSAATGINGDQRSGAVYIYRRD